MVNSSKKTEKPYFDVDLSSREDKAKSFRLSDLRFLTDEANGGRLSARSFNGSSEAQKQRVTVKARVVKHKVKGRQSAARVKGQTAAPEATVDHVKAALRSHLSYIAREQAVEPGLEHKVLTENGCVAQAEMSRRLAEWALDPHSFRFIVSPERGHDIHLDLFAQMLMAQVERDLGEKLEWYASCHYNTHKPHIHICVRGTDSKGRALFIPKKYMSHGFRGAAEDLGTLLLGKRRPIDQEIAAQQQIKIVGFTSLDRELIELSRQNDHRIVTIESDRHPIGSWQRQRRAHLMSRLAFLEGCALALPMNGQQWYLREDLERKLRSLQRREAAQRVAEEHCKGKVWNNEVVVHLEDSLEAPVVRGVIAGKSIVDELNDKWALTIIDFSGTAHYYPLDRFTEPGFVKVKEGAIVTAKRTAGNSTDLRILDFSRRHGGIFSAKAFREEIEAADPFRGHRLPPRLSIDEYVEALKTRCQTLVGFGIGIELGGDSWAIPSDLGKQLSIFYEKSGQVRRSFTKLEVHSYLSIDEQVNHDGVTWLDELVAFKLRSRTLPSYIETDSSSPVVAAIERRVHVLEKRGVPLTRGYLNRLKATEWTKALREIERRHGPLAALEPGESIEAQVMAPWFVGNRVYALVRTVKGHLLVRVARERLAEGMTIEVTCAGDGDLEFRISRGQERGASLGR